ncbi:MAG: hypothetical protein NT062_37790 [Proteobacteria bacterium]|nr:hypothetical protein [Pseudomonadota bacterium]
MRARLHLRLVPGCVCAAAMFLVACGRLDFDPVVADDTCLAEEFTAPVLDPGTWSSFADPPTTVTTTGGELVLTLASTPGIAYAGIQSPRGDFRGSTVDVEVVEVPQAADGAVVEVAVLVDFENQHLMNVLNRQLTCQQLVAGTTVDVTTLPFDPVLHRHWRLEHDATTNRLRCATSPDGLTWTTQHEATAQIPLTNTLLQLDAGTYAMLAAPVRARFDHLAVTGCRLP